MKNMSLEERAYEVYKMIWAREHVPTEILLKTVRDYIQEIDEYESFEDYIFENGYMNGMVYACFDEFLDCEFLDKEFVKTISTEEEFEKYLEEYGDLLEEE